MRILDVSPRVTLPLSSGSRIRMYNLLSRLSRENQVLQFSQTRSRDVRSQTFAPEAQIAPQYTEYRYRNFAATPFCEIMERSGFGVPTLSGYPLHLFRPRRLAEWMEWADLAVVEFPWQFGYCRRIARGKPVVLATHNVQAAKIRSGGRGGLADRIWAAWTEALERNAVREADLVLAVSPEDRGKFVRRYGADPARIHVAPNGADIHLYRPASVEERTALRAEVGLPPGRMVIFPAPHRQTPILEAMKWVRRAAACLPDVTFLVTGAVEAIPKKDGNLLFTGFVDGYERYLRSADCLLCPIDRGGGTKLKLIEAAAAGLPIVAFPESVRGTTFGAEEHLLIVSKDLDAVVAGLRRILDGDEIAARLGATVRAHAVFHYNWDIIARNLEAALARLLPAASMASLGREA